MESCLGLPSLVSFLFFGASWVNVLLRERNRSTGLEYREDLGLFQEEQPSQMGTIFLVMESKQGIIREEPYQFRIILFSLLQGTMHLFASATTLTLGRKGGREWLMPASNSLFSTSAMDNSGFLSPTVFLENFKGCSSY